MHIKHLLFLLTLVFFTHLYSMDLHDITHGDDPVLWITMPEDIWIQIIAQCTAKDTFRKTCTYFRALASTSNKKIFLQNPLLLSSAELLNDYALYYAELGDNVILSNLLANGADPNTQDDHNKSLLYYAAKNRNLTMIEVLLNHPIINITKIADNTQGIADGSGSPFHVALQRGYSEIAKRILSVNNVNVLSPLRSAIEKSHVDIVAHILSMDIPLHYFEEALFTAARWDRIEIISIILSHNVNINCSSKIGSSTPLYVAVAHGHLAMVQFLVKHGATINITADSGRTPLYKAIEEGYVNVARFLIEQGADIQIKGPMGYSLLVAAFAGNKRKNCTQLMQLLMRKGIDVNRKQDGFGSGNVALHYAVLSRRVEVVRLLLEQPDIKVNEIDNYNKTPLDRVCFSHGYDAVLNDEEENAVINGNSKSIEELLIAHGGKTFAQLQEMKMQNDKI